MVDDEYVNWAEDCIAENLPEQFAIYSRMSGVMVGHDTVNWAAECMPEKSLDFFAILNFNEWVMVARVWIELSLSWAKEFNHAGNHVDQST